MTFVRKLVELKILADTLTDGLKKQPFSLHHKILFLTEEFGVVSPAVLMSKLGVVKSNLAIACRELCLKKYIIAFKDERDKRQVHYKLTEEGKQEIDNVISNIDSLYREDEISQDVKRNISALTDFLNRKV